MFLYHLLLPHQIDKTQKQTNKIKLWYAKSNKCFVLHNDYKDYLIKQKNTYVKMLNEKGKKHNFISNMTTIVLYIYQMRASLVAQLVKNPPAMQETPV